MAMSNITVKGITPNLHILGAKQRFTYDYDNTAGLEIYNTWAPTNALNSITFVPWLNNNFSGFAWVHETDLAGNIGTFSLRKVINNVLGDTVFSVLNDGTLNLMITSNKISDFNNAVNALIAAAGGGGGGGGLISLSGAVTGSGTSSIPTLLSSNIVAQAALQTLDFNFSTNTVEFRINNSAPIPAEYFNQTQTRLSIFNSKSGGYYFEHNTNVDNDYGTLTLYAKKLNTSAQQLLKVDLNDVTPKILVSADFYCTSSNSYFGAIFVPTPTSTGHAVNKLYVDNLVAGNVTSKLATNVAPTQNILNMNWNNTTDLSQGGTGVPYVLTHTLSDNAPQYKALVNKLTSAQFVRTWTETMNLGDSNSFNPSYSLSFNHTIVTGTVTPINITYTGTGNGTIITDCTLNMSSKKITNLLAGTANTDAINLLQLNSKTFTTASITDFNTATNSLIAAAQRAYACIYMEGNTAATSISAGVWKKVNGTTTAGLMNVFTMPTDNRITNSGSSTIQVKIDANLTFLINNTSVVLTLGIFKNSVQVIPTLSSAYFYTNTTYPNNITTSTMQSLDPGDYVEVYVKATGSYTNFTPVNLIFTVTTL